MLAALAGGLVAVIAIGFGARALFGGHKDEVIERLERATSGGGWTSAMDARARARDARSRASPASCARSPGW